MKNNLLKGVGNTTPHLIKKGEICCGIGKSYNILDFKESDVDINFISNSLSKIMRYDGHYNKDEGYSVAQHSVMMAQSALLCYGDPTLAKQCLYHDCSEAYCSDIVKPLKTELGSSYSDIEKAIEDVVNLTLLGTTSLDKRVKEIDMNIAQYEMTILLSPSNNISDTFCVWNVKKSKSEFMNMITKIEILETYSEKYNLYERK